MDHSALIVLVSVLATLAFAGALGGTALLVGAYMSQRERLAATVHERDAYKERLAAAALDLAKLRQLRGNKLYNRALGDLGFAAKQAVIHLRALEAEAASELAVVLKLLETAPKE